MSPAIWHQRNESPQPKLNLHYYPSLQETSLLDDCTDAAMHLINMIPLSSKQKREDPNLIDSPKCAFTDFVAAVKIASGSLHVLVIDDDTRMRILELFTQSKRTQIKVSEIPSKNMDSTLQWKRSAPNFPRMETSKRLDHFVLTSRTTTSWFFPWHPRSLSRERFQTLDNCQQNNLTRFFFNTFKVSNIVN